MSPEAVAALPPTTRVILAAGPYRSGSTPLYNIARLVLEREGNRITSGWIDDIAAPVDSTVLLKVHEWHSGLARRADVVLTCHRDLRAVARSLASMGWLWGYNIPGASAIDHIGTIVRLHAQWSARAAVDLRYEDMVRDWTDATARIAHALGVTLISRALAEIVRMVRDMPAPLEGGTSGYDPRTLLFPKHRSVGATGGGLPRALEAEIHRCFGNWQVARGYADGPAETAHAASRKSGG
jgi:hypothetical protein